MDAGNDDDTVSTAGSFAVRITSASGANSINLGNNDTLTLDNLTSVSELHGDNSDDIIDMMAQSQFSRGGASAPAVGFGAYALNDVQAAAGKDEITAGTFVYSDSTGGNREAQINVDAGTGNDMIDSTISSDFSALDEVRVTSVLIAGTGADTVTSQIDAFATSDINVFNQISGGGGADVISSTIVVESFGAATSVDVTETISGGSSADMITSVLTAPKHLT